MAAAFAGKWNNISSENFDGYLKEVGVSMITRTVASKLKPTLIFEITGDDWVMTSISTFKTHVTKFTLGKEFDDKTIDGRETTSTFTLEGDRLIQVEKGKSGGKDSRIERFIQDGKLVIVCTSGAVSCTRMYEKAAA